MAETIRYLVTTDAATGATLKVERVGDAGELTEVPAATFGASAHVCPPSAVFHFHLGQGGVTSFAASGPQPGPGVGPQPGPGVGPQPGPGVGPQPGPGVGPQPGPGVGPQPGPGPQPAPKPPKKS